MKWKYDKRYKQWWTCEHDCVIRKENEKYVLTRGYFTTIGRFRLLKNAQLVAELLVEG